MVSSHERAVLEDAIRRARVRADATGGAGSTGGRNSERSALILVGIDAFTVLNERYGREVGDAVLGVIEQRLAAVVRATDPVVRIAQDEFAVHCDDCGREHALVVADRLRGAVTRPVAVAGTRLGVDVSIGVAHSQGSQDLQTLVDRAEQALRSAQSQGRNHVSLSAPET